MSWIWQIRQGKLGHHGYHVGSGYSGIAEWKNNPDACSAPNKGPIPTGAWLIGEPYDSKLRGPMVLPLLALNGTETFGRAAFLIHGDSSEHPGEASHGCIILPPTVRRLIAVSRDRQLIVISGDDLKEVDNVPSVA